MDKLVIQGGHPLTGDIYVSGAKNSVVAILPATLLLDVPCILENVPDISDVKICLSILESLGAQIDKLSEVISGTGMLTLEIEGGVGTVKNALSSVDGVRRVMHHSGNSYTVSFDTDTDVRRGVFKALARADCPILSMTTGGLTLEESFLKLTEGGDD